LLIKQSYRLSGSASNCFWAENQGVKNGEIKFSEKIQDLEKGLPMNNIGLATGWLWKMTNSAILVLNLLCLSHGY